MPPGSTMFRFFGSFGENVPRNGRHECLPYSRNVVRAQFVKQQFVVLFARAVFLGGGVRRPLAGVRGILT